MAGLVKVVFWMFLFSSGLMPCYAVLWTYDGDWNINSCHFSFFLCKNKVGISSEGPFLNVEISIKLRNHSKLRILFFSKTELYQIEHYFSYFITESSCFMFHKYLVGPTSVTFYNHFYFLLRFDFVLGLVATFSRTSKGRFTPLFWSYSTL